MIRGVSSNRRTMDMMSDLQYVAKATGKLQDMLDIVLNYVDDVMVSVVVKDVLREKYRKTWKKVHLRSKILECPSIGDYHTFK